MEKTIEMIKKVAEISEVKESFKIVRRYYQSAEACAGKSASGYISDADRVLNDDEYWVKARVEDLEGVLEVHNAIEDLMGGHNGAHIDTPVMESVFMQAIQGMIALLTSKISECDQEIEALASQRVG